MASIEIKTTVREFLRNFKQLTVSQKTIIVSKNGTPQGVFVPYEKWQKQEKKDQKSINLAEIIEKYSFESGPKNLSDPDFIDEAVYGASNPYRKNDNS